MTALHLYLTTQSSHINSQEHWYIQKFKYLLVKESSLDHRTTSHRLIILVGRLQSQNNFAIDKY